MFLGKSPALKNYDVIVFEEAFDDRARDILADLLAAEYPHQTSVLTGDHDGQQETNGGVFIVSRWPFVPFKVPPNHLRESWDYVYDACSGSGWRCLPLVPGQCDPDCLANKGVKYVRVNKLGRIHHISGPRMRATIPGTSALGSDEEMRSFMPRAIHRRTTRRTRRDHGR
jgi:hypothetical protein